MRSFTYFIGEPGSGKSTLMKALTAGMPSYEMGVPIPHTLWDRKVAEVGRYRKDFSGTDALSMGIQPQVVKWLEQYPYRTIMAEGDRLANAKFFNAVQAAGYELRVVALLVQPHIVEARRTERASALGKKPQNETWVKGRRSKVLKLANDFAAHPLYGTNRTPEELVMDLTQAGLNPFNEETVIGYVNPSGTGRR